MAGRKGKRARRYLEDVEVDEPHSALAEHLKQQFAFGLMSASQCQMLASLAVQDHRDSPADLLALSKIGSSGRHMSNCYKELLDLMQPRKLNADLAMKIPMLSNKRIWEARRKSLVTMA